MSLKQKTVTYFDDEQGYLFKVNKEFIRIFKGCGLPENLTEGETAKVYRLSLLMHKGSNLICYRSGNVIRAMSTGKIAQYFNINERQANLFINKMIGIRLMAKVRVQVGQDVETQYYINPIYFFNGKWLNYNLYFLFKQDLDNILPEWVKDKFNQELRGKDG